jgi:hypothetical protein
MLLCASLLASLLFVLYLNMTDVIRYLNATSIVQRVLRFACISHMLETYRFHRRCHLPFTIGFNKILNTASLNFKCLKICQAVRTYLSPCYQHGLCGCDLLSDGLDQSLF